MLKVSLNESAQNGSDSVTYFRAAGMLFQSSNSRQHAKRAVESLSAFDPRATLKCCALKGATGRKRGTLRDSLLVSVQCEKNPLKCLELVGAIGFEPTTPCAQVMVAPGINGGLGHLHALWNQHIKACFFGACFFVQVVILRVAVRKAPSPRSCSRQRLSRRFSEHISAFFRNAAGLSLLFADGRLSGQRCPINPLSLFLSGGGRAVTAGFRTALSKMANWCSSGCRSCYAQAFPGDSQRWD